jgi:hypothetical protein
VSTFAFYHPICFTILVLAGLLTGLALWVTHGGIYYIETYRPIEHFEDKRKMP